MAAQASTDLLIHKKRSDHRSHDQRASETLSLSIKRANGILVEPKPKVTDITNVPVIYYLSQNGQLEHPHFVQVPLSSHQGLYLRDVIDRLNYLRGEGLGYMYSWSAKRSYNNGYVWQDLTEDDLIHPTNSHGHDYVLKGSKLHVTSTTETTPSGSRISHATRRRKNQSWSSFENPEERNEYIVLKCESSRDFAGKFSPATDAATQTEERRWSSGGAAEKIMEELSREELSPPLSMSSSVGSEGTAGSGDHHPTAQNECHSIGKIKGYKALMQFVSCRSLMPFKYYGSIKNKSNKMKASLD